MFMAVLCTESFPSPIPIAGGEVSSHTTLASHLHKWPNRFVAMSNGKMIAMRKEFQASAL